MKVETKLAKLNALLGLQEKAADIKVRSTGNVVGITEEEIQEFREAQGIIYFLQAPELFQSKVCTYCEEPFLVSRKYVGCCSYSCIRKSLNEQGIEWRKGRDLEALAIDPQVWNGNEPLWIRKNSMLKLQEALKNLSENLPDKENQYTSSTTEKSLPDTTGSSPTITHTGDTKPPTSSSSVPTTTSQSNRVVGKRSSKRTSKKRRIISEP